VFVLGGGPSGSTVATLLAERGRDVVIVEKERHPRFHIGESLLPLNLPLFDKLGVTQRIEAIAMRKYGAEFTSPHHDKPVTFDFADAWDKAHGLAYQVRRSEFDQILFENCIGKGARALQGCQVTDVEIEEDGVRVRARESDGTQHEWDAEFLVDASGRQTFLANKFGIKQSSRKHGSAALFGHFAGAERLPGREEGNISIFWFEHGWFWFIPLLDGTTSVGAVCAPAYLASRRTDPTTFLLQTIALCPALADRLRHATLTNEVMATGNYSYESERMVGERYILLGDAYAFVDPVFSSGVLLAMNSAFHGAEVVDTWLRDPDQAQPLMRQFDRTVRHGIRHFSWFIYRMTSPAIRELFMHPRNPLRMQEALVSLLAGDLFRGTPIHWSLRAFKGLYYVTSLRNFRRCLAAWRRRKRTIRDLQTESSVEARM
jgi:2-polyprenyl-6-methoxyphenol hydroxylase-like FAD-dependent oxidoreductase